MAWALEHISQIGGNLRDGELAAVLAVDFDLAPSGLQQANRVFDERGLARAVGPQQGDDLAGATARSMSCSTSGPSS